MHLEKPILVKHLGDPILKGFAVLQKIFFAASPSSQAAGGAFIERLARRKEDLDTIRGPMWRLLKSPHSASGSDRMRPGSPL